LCLGGKFHHDIGKLVLVDQGLSVAVIGVVHNFSHFLMR
jgi:hypothetical protein